MCRKAAQNLILRRNNLSVIAIFLLAIVYLWPIVLNPTYIPMTKNVQITDFTVAHLSFANYIHNMWFAYGYPPLWNSGMLSGMPLVADPLSGYYYLPNWLTFLFPKPIAYNFLFLFHIFWTGLGLFLFLKPKTKNTIAAFFGAAVWMGTPKLIAYIGSGQVSSVFALSWMPWLLFVLEKLVRFKKLPYLYLVICLLSTLILIDIRWGFMAGLFALFYFVFHMGFRSLKNKQIILGLILFVTFLFFLTAVLTLPLIELMNLSDRSALSVSERAGYSLSGIELLGIFMPQSGILFELVTYLGVVVLLLAGLGIQRKNWFWGIVIGFSLLVSLGSNTVVFSLMHKFIPGFSWLRVPSRFWFFVALGVVILSSYGVDRLISNQFSFGEKSRIKIASMTFGAFAAILGLGFVMFFQSIPSGILIFSLITPITLIIVNILLRYNKTKLVYPIIFLALVDILLMNASVFTSVELSEKSGAVQWLEKQPGIFRVYSPTYSVPVPNNLQTVEGVNPSHLLEYRILIEEASVIKTSDYSVSVPAIYLDAQSPKSLFVSAASPDLEIFGLLNTKYIVSGFPINNLNSIYYDGISLIYENTEYKERVWVEDEIGTSEIKFWSPDLIEAAVNLNQAGEVVFSEISYPGWRAYIDERQVPIEKTRNILRSVYVTEGNHEIVLRYHPTYFYIGLSLSSIGWIYMIFYWRPYAKSFLEGIRSIFS